MMSHSMVVDTDLDMQTAEGQFLAAIPDGLRPRVLKLLMTPRCGGRGLRAWVSRMETDSRPLPELLPDALIEIYLKDDEAEPIHDCEDCGLPVPVRVGRRLGCEPVVERVYFPACPHCGGRTGRYAFWSRGSNPSPIRYH